MPQLIALTSLYAMCERGGYLLLPIFAFLTIFGIFRNFGKIRDFPEFFPIWVKFPNPINQSWIGANFGSIIRCITQSNTLLVVTINAAKVVIVKSLVQ